MGLFRPRLEIFETILWKTILLRLLGFSGLLKNCVEQAISVLVCVISSAGQFFVSFFRAAERPMWSFQRRSETLRPGLTPLETRRPSGFACAPGCKPRKQR